MWCLHCQAQNVPLFRCGGCKLVTYCGAECQQANWHMGEHSVHCDTLKQIGVKRPAERGEGGKGQKKNSQGTKKEEEVINPFNFGGLPKGVALMVLRHLWLDGRYDEVLRVATFSKAFNEFMQSYVNVKRGGVLGYMLEMDDPSLKQRAFPYLSYLLFKYPKSRWNANWLSRNPSIRWWDVKYHLHHGIRFDFRLLSANPGIQMPDIVSNLALYPWRMNQISRNPNLTINFAVQYADFMDWNAVCENPNIVAGRDLLNNPVVRVNFIDNARYPQDIWKHISQNPTVTEEDVLTHLDQPWHWRYLSKNPNLRLEFIMEHSNDLLYISENPNVTPDFVRAHPEMNWNYLFLSTNPNMTLDFIVETMTTEKWAWGDLSMHMDVRRDILRHPELPWVWALVMKNPTLRSYQEATSVLQGREESEKKRFLFHYLTENPNATWDEVMQHIRILIQQHQAIWDDHVVPFIRFVMRFRLTEQEAADYTLSVIEKKKNDILFNVNMRDDTLAELFKRIHPMEKRVVAVLKRYILKEITSLGALRAELDNVNEFIGSMFSSKKDTFI